MVLLHSHSVKRLIRLKFSPHFSPTRTKSTAPET